MKSLTIATRESPLALWQAEWVKNQLQTLYPQLIIHLLGITTQADKLLATPLREIGGKGLFVKELEDALLDGRADIAVHSMKDVPMVLHPELVVPVICVREEVRDAFVSDRYVSWQELPENACIGTSSLRRQSQLQALCPGIAVRDLRGNVGTRLRKLDEGEFDAIILAAAGLARLGLGQRICSYFAVEDMLPAAGQGALGIECSKHATALMRLLAPLNHVPTFVCVTAERAMCRRLDGNCRVPLAAYAIEQSGEVTLRGMVASADGAKILHAQQSAECSAVEQLGHAVAAELLRQGASEILQVFKK